MLQRYEAYKESGVDWLGEIPEGWEVKRLKYVTDERNEKVSASESALDYYGMESVVSWSGTLSGEPIKVDGLSNLFFEDDVLFGKLRPYLAKICHADRSGRCSTEFMVLRPGKNSESAYLAKLLISPNFVWMIDGSTYGSKMPRANPEYIKNCAIPLPPLPEQTAIAKFLDEKTAKIDELVEIKRLQIALLGERKQILIQNAVTKGLNPDAPMKESGVEWIGEIPAHWEVKRLKYLANSKNDKIASEETGLRYYGMMNVESWTGRIVGKKIQADGLANSFSKGDVLFGKLRPYLAKACLAKEDGICSTEFMVFSCGQQLSNEYLLNLVLSANFVQHINSSTYGSKMPRANPDFVNNSLIPSPSNQEQIDIATVIGKQSEEINTTIKIKQSQIEKLNEYKTTLINAAVTGKIKVV